MAIGRTTDARTATVGTTNADATVTAASGTFNEEDAGAAISGTGIPNGATIATVTSSTSIELSAAATATGASVTATITPKPENYGFKGWSPETDAESETYSVGASGTPPSVLSDSTTKVTQRERTYS